MLLNEKFKSFQQKIVQMSFICNFILPVVFLVYKS